MRGLNLKNKVMREIKITVEDGWQGELSDILDELSVYLADKADADYIDGTRVPNTEMKLQTAIDRIKIVNMPKEVICESSLSEG